MVYKHLKTGNLYVYIGTANEKEFVIYMSSAGLFVKPFTEFYAKFEQVADQLGK